MKLYYSPGACSLSPHIVLCEAGIDAQLVKVDLKTHKTESGQDFYAVNGRGYVPVLELDDGKRLTEGPVIVQYLADSRPGSGLAPAAGTMERYRLQEWLNLITSELHKGIGSLFNPDMPDAWREQVKKTAGARLDWIAQHLEDKDYLMGADFSVADAYLFTVLGWTKWLGIDLAAWPALQRYVARVAARPKVQEAMRAEGLGG